MVEKVVFWNLTLLIKWIWESLSKLKILLSLTKYLLYLPMVMFLLNLSHLKLEKVLTLLLLVLMVVEKALFSEF